MAKTADPREVGKTYHSHYWDENYIVLDILTDEDGTKWFSVQWESGHQAVHCTKFDPRDKEVVKMETEKLYLECRECGEVFDTLETAKAHESECEEFLPGETYSYFIRTEGEAF